MRKKADLVGKRLLYLNWYMVHFFHFIFTVAVCKPFSGYFQEMFRTFQSLIVKQNFGRGFQAYCQFVIPWKDRETKKERKSTLISLDHSALLLIIHNTSIDFLAFICMLISRKANRKENHTRGKSLLSESLLEGQNNNMWIVHHMVSNLSTFTST